MKSCELVFFRHGIADNRTPDESRILTDEGSRKTHGAAEGLKKLDIAFEAVFTSPWARARQTAEIVASVLELPEPVVLPELAGDREPAELLAALRSRSVDNSVLVGHQPLLSETIAVLLGAGGKCQIDLRKSGACSLLLDAIPPKRPAVLNWLMSSKQLRSL